ncbi:MAG: acyl-CoA reductase [Candidatus Eremiobacteraeota bacterium]|nr:acyl-CoA reductase [Candidatus Eremiobacteraeota bacterium]
MLDAGVEQNWQLGTLLRGAQEWGDSQSAVRCKARAALRDGEWPEQTVERALDFALLDFERVLSQLRSSPLSGSASQSLLCVLPGNIIGPAVTCAYCAAAAGPRLIMKSSQSERRLAELVAEQFDGLGPPLRGMLQPVYWKGGDTEREAEILRAVRRVIVFGRDETIASLEQRAPATTRVIGYGDGVSVGFVSQAADIAAAARASSWDVAMFDQRGCMSPQTIYVEGDDSRAVLFAQALAYELDSRENDLPRARPDDAEKTALADVMRRLQVTALPAATHALGTMHFGPKKHGVPAFIVTVAPFAAPTSTGFGRVAVVKPCADAGAAAGAAAALGSKLETVGIAGGPASVFARAGARRVCPLGEMQAPPFGYRPRIADFLAETA